MDLECACGTPQQLFVRLCVLQGQKDHKGRLSSWQKTEEVKFSNATCRHHGKNVCTVRICHGPRHLCKMTYIHAHSVCRHSSCSPIRLYVFNGGMFPQLKSHVFQIRLHLVELFVNFVGPTALQRRHTSINFFTFLYA